MQVRTIRQPGERGTRQLAERFGKRLVCVRYRFDPEKRKRYKTVEPVVAAKLWMPSRHPCADKRAPARARRYTPRVPVRIGYHEKDLQRRFKAIGGNWEPARKLWYAPEEYVRRIGLDRRIVR